MSSSDSQLPVVHLFLHQVLHPPNLHLVHVIHKAGPVCAAVTTVHGLRVVGGGLRGRVVVSGGHTVAAVADAEASESGGNAGSCEGLPAALARHWPVVSVDLPGVHTGGEEIRSLTTLDVASFSQL